jgi:hypothetical protein
MITFTNGHSIFDELATSDGRRIFMDIATVKQQKQGPNVNEPNWRIMASEQMQLKFSGFFHTKDTMTEPTCEQFHKWKQAKLPVLCQDGRSWRKQEANG